MSNKLILYGTDLTPSMTLVASVMKLESRVLEMKGNVLEARRLHSITFTQTPTSESKADSADTEQREDGTTSATHLTRATSIIITFLSLACRRVVLHCIVLCCIVIAL